MGVNRLRRGEAIAAGGAVALLADMFLKWYGFSLADAAGGAGAARALGVDVGLARSFTAWQAFDILDLFLLLVILVAIGLAVLTLTQRAAALPVAASVITTALGILATLLVLIRIVDQPGSNTLVDAEYGAYLGLLCCAAIAVGGWLSMRDEGTSLEDAGRQVRRAANEPGGRPDEPGGAPAAPGEGSSAP